MLSAIFSSVGMSLINGFLDKALAAFTAYQNKQISVEQLKDQLYAAMVAAAKDVEIAHADTLAKTYATFWTAANADKSNLMKIMWAAALGSQIFVLFWSQWCVPLLFAYGFLPNWKAGTTAEWSYLLIGALLGLGPMVLRSGPSAATITDKLKAMIGK
jgi:hypothetical protein